MTKCFFFDTVVRVSGVLGLYVPCGVGVSGQCVCKSTFKSPSWCSRRTKAKFGSGRQVNFTKQKLLCKASNLVPEVSVFFANKKMYMVVEIMCCESM